MAFGTSGSWYMHVPSSETKYYKKVQKKVCYSEREKLFAFGFVLQLIISVRFYLP